MKILFICGSIEKNKDGVGDYVRRLSAALQKKGFTTTIIALNDKFISQVKQESQECDDCTVGVFRLSSKTAWRKRFALFKNIREAFNPDLISIQYVPYSFHDKGVPLFLFRNLNRIGKKSRWHIMFHELSIGIDRNSSTKERIIGFVQQQIIDQGIKTLSPIIIHTQTKIYQHLLSKSFPNVFHIPLFSNIPVKSAQQYKSSVNDEDAISFVIFGSIHHGAPITEFCLELSAYCRKINKKGILLIVGRNNSSVYEWKDEWEKQGSVHILGEKNSEEISRIFNTVNFGIVTTPYLLVEKSGSAAAMLEHGLPVICVARNWQPRFTYTELNENASILNYHPGKLVHLLGQNNYRRPKEDALVKISQQFINDLQSSWQD